jgi:hypothetical protein
MPAQVHIGDVGTVFEATILDQDNDPVDLSASTVRQLFFRKPNGIIVPKVAVLSGSGTDGKIRWVTTVTSDLDVTGLWEWQGYVEVGGGAWHSDVLSFRVHRNLA